MSHPDQVSVWTMIQRHPTLVQGGGARCSRIGQSPFGHEPCKKCKEVDKSPWIKGSYLKTNRFRNFGGNSRHVGVDTR